MRPGRIIEAKNADDIDMLTRVFAVQELGVKQLNIIYAYRSQYSSRGFLTERERSHIVSMFRQYLTDEIVIQVAIPVEKAAQFKNVEQAKAAANFKLARDKAVAAVKAGAK
jgi:hypothetical protein